MPHVINLPKPVVDAEEENPFAHMAEDEELFEVRLSAVGGSQTVA